MEKQFKDITVDFIFDWENGIKISKLREDLDELERLGADKIIIEAKDAWEVPYLEIEAVYRRLETDEEFQRRIAVLNNEQERIKARELKQLEELKNKYERPNTNINTGA